MIYFLYPSCRPDQIADAVQRVRVNVPSTIVVGCNGPRTLCKNIAFQTDLMLWFGEKLFNPSYAKVMTFLARAMVRRFNPTDEDLIAYWSDDFYPQSGFPDKIFEAREKFPNRRFIQVMDGVLNGERAATIPFITWGWLKEHMGGLFWPPCYRYVVDVEPYRKAKITGDFLYLPECFIKHRNHFAGTRPIDHVDRHNLIRDNHDWNLINQRESLGFPVDWNGESFDNELPRDILDVSLNFLGM